jgi:hypothetical protein
VIFLYLPMLVVVLSRSDRNQSPASQD